MGAAAGLKTQAGGHLWVTLDDKHAGARVSFDLLPQLRNILLICTAQTAPCFGGVSEYRSSQKNALRGQYEAVIMAKYEPPLFPSTRLALKSLRTGPDVKKSME